MDKFAPILLITIFIIAAIPIAIFTVANETFEEKTLNLWYVQAPFGVCYGDVEGHFIWGSGSISTSLVEAYVVKYWDGDLLRSFSVDAVDTPIMVDGSFKLTGKLRHQYDVFGIEIFTKYNDWHYILHLPSLPENVTIGMIDPNS